MIYNIKRYLSLYILALMMFLGTKVFAQVQVTQRIDSLSILIGEQTDLHLIVNLKKGVHAQLPYFKPKDLLAPGIEVVETKDGENEDLDHGMQKIERIYTITSFDEKLYPIPPLDVVVNGQTYHGNQLALKVLTVPVDTISVVRQDLKDVQNNPFLWSEWSPVFWLSILMLTLFVLAIFFFIRMKQNKPIRVSFKVVKKIPPHEKALKDIDEIKHQHADSQESQKVYYTKLTDTLRSYIENRFGFNAMEMTSSEIIEKLQENGDKAMINELKNLFQTADLVKFAKYETLINENDYNLVNAIKFIDETKTNEEELEEKIAPKLTEEELRQNSQHRTLKVLTFVMTILSIALLVYVLYRITMLMI